MTLGEFISKYLAEKDISIREFSAMVKMSPQQFSNIIKGIGNNGKPMSSTMKTYKKIADALGMSESEFLKMLNDDVQVNPTVTDEDIKFALFGGDGEITDEMFEEVKRFAAYVKQRDKEKKE